MRCNFSMFNFPHPQCTKAQRRCCFIHSPPNKEGRPDFMKPFSREGWPSFSVFESLSHADFAENEKFPPADLLGWVGHQLRSLRSRFPFGPLRQAYPDCLTNRSLRCVDSPHVRELCSKTKKIPADLSH